MVQGVGFFARNPHQFLEAELTPYDHKGRIKLDGPEVRLPPKHALSLTLTLHELATNAAKYGGANAPSRMAYCCKRGVAPMW